MAHAERSTIEMDKGNTIQYIYIYIHTVSQKELCKIVYVRTLSNFHQLQ